MSGFGLRALKKSNKTNQQSKKCFYYKHIVYGENLFGVLTFLKLRKKFPGKVLLITKNPFLKENVINEWNCTLNSVRSENVFNAYKKLESELSLATYFYKDTKLHKFGGRAKAHELKNEEAFYSQSSYPTDLISNFDPEDFKNLDDILEKGQKNKIISAIEVESPKDLVERVNFNLKSGDKESYTCEHLYFCESPKKFLSLVVNKSQLDDDIYQFAAGVTNTSALSVYYEADQKVFDIKGTVIIPQSMTHDWGSFVVEISPFNEQAQTQSFKALTFLDEDDLQDEDLAKKMRLMRRVLERVFPKLTKAKLSKTIRFSDEYLMTSSSDNQYQKIKDDPIKFVGQSTPLECEHAHLFKSTSRGLFAISQLEL